jgi:hypothetical protein
MNSEKMIALISETLNNRKIVGDVDKSDIVNIRA